MLLLFSERYLYISTSNMALCDETEAILQGYMLESDAFRV